MKVLELGSDSPAADAARGNLALLDVDPNAASGPLPRKVNIPQDRPAPLVTSVPAAEPAQPPAKPALPELPRLGGPKRAEPE